MKSSSLYSDPVEHAICFNEKEHQIHWYQMNPDESCPDCDETPPIKRCYLPLKEKLMRWFQSEEMCTAMLGHWKNRDRWLGKEGPTFPLKEIWDGTRFKEIQWFFDPLSKWPLPHTCKKCEHKTILQNVVDEDEVEVTCPNCGLFAVIQPEFCHGDPRNIVFIGHWDGWQPKVGRRRAKSSGEN